MGCDGGTIPKRHELVRTKKKAEEKDKNADLIAKWNYCALSSEPLREPIVACEIGRLYSKDAILEYLLDKAVEKVDKVAHIKGLKDVHTLNIQPNPSWKNKTDHAEKGDGYIDDQDSKYICPIAGVEMNGRYKFCYLRSCGCVFSKRALKEVQEQSCPTCSKKYTKDDIIVLNGSKEEEEEQKKRMEARKDASRSERKKKKEKKKVNGVEKLANCPATKKNDEQPSTSGTSKSANHDPGPGHVKKLEVNGTINGPKRKIKEHKTYNSEAFKSIFTSHHSAKRAKDAQGHWITYNPYHYAG